jgi:hypothetical protein
VDNNIDTNFKTEILNRPPNEQLLELRKYAIEQGIAPNQVDNYLLNQEWVSNEVKTLIRQSAENPQYDAEGRRGQNVSAGGRENMPQRNVVDGGQVDGGQNVEQAGDGSGRIEGSVDIMNTKTEMERIKQESQVSQGGAPVETGPQPTQQEQVIQQVEGQEFVGSQEQLPQQEREAQREQDQDIEESQEQAAVHPEVQDNQSQGMSMEDFEMEGYQVEPDIVQNCDEIANNPVDESATWQAKLVQRFIQMWQRARQAIS